MAEGWNPKDVFYKALGLPKAEREAYLQTACPNEEARAEVRKLLQHHDEMGSAFLIDPAKTATLPPSAPRMIAEFRIISLLGEGGMGVVYLAEDTILGRHVALKVLARHLTGSEQALARFREEARSAAALTHPGIVPVFKFGQDGDTHYLASEYVDGPTLAFLIADRKNAGKTASQSHREWHRRVAEMIAGLADALDCAHRANIVHRDVKPSNILVDKRLGPRLTDFGIAKHLVEEDRTQTTKLIGSCHYMSPEQASIAGKRVDQRSDIFSLGVILYELLSLRKPFDGPDATNILRAVLESQPPRLRAIDMRIPKDLETICLKAMEKDPAHRFQTAAHVAADLRCFLIGAPILAQPPRVSRRVRYWLRIHKTACLIVLVIGLVFLSSVVIASSYRQAASQWRAERCCIQPGAIKMDVAITCRPILAETLSLGEPIPADGSGFFWVRPGQYRLTYLAPDGRFAEVDEYLASPGQVVPLTPIFVDGTHCDEPMVWVPGDMFEVGDFDGDPTSPKRRVAINSFCMDRHEVSNKEFLAFLQATGWRRPRGWKTLGSTWPPPEFDDRPVVAISWDDMQAYVQWCGKRLPTYLEWEYAARYPDGRIYPWGDAGPNPDLVTANESHRILMKLPDGSGLAEVYRELSRPTHADRHPSALGLHFLAGNAAEMTSTIMTTEQTHAGVVKGGSWMDVSESSLTQNVTFPLDAGWVTVGFRCVRSAMPMEKKVPK